ncbi:MAG: hypothetical protein ACM3NR_02390 [Methanosarcina sp.]
MRIISFSFLLLAFILLSCEKEEKIEISDAAFISFTTNGQTLPTAIHKPTRELRFEVDTNVDVRTLMPHFDIPELCEVYVNGVRQTSGNSTVDFTNPVLYELKDVNNRTVTWKASAVKLTKKILIDASHDGGVWWFPQYGTYDQNKPHQGQRFADLLRKDGYIVDELGRGAELTEEMFFGYYIVIRADGFMPYTPKELSVYTNLIDRGMNLVFFTDHKKNDPVDELGDYLGLHFRGIANGVVNKFKSQAITENLTSLDYIAGSVLTDYKDNKKIEVLGWLREQDYGDINMNGVKDADEPSAPAVMGILKYPKCSIFFVGDMNGLQIMPQPFIDNLKRWMGNGL